VKGIIGILYKSVQKALRDLLSTRRKYPILWDKESIGMPTTEKINTDKNADPIFTLKNMTQSRIANL